MEYKSMQPTEFTENPYNEFGTVDRNKINDMETLIRHIRKNAWNLEFRESLAQALEWTMGTSRNALAQEIETSALATDLQDQFNRQIGALTQDAEVIDARGGKATLGQRLDETTAQLAQTKEEMFYSSPINSKKNKPMMVWIDDDAHINIRWFYKNAVQERGIPFTFAVVTDRLERDTTLSIPEMVELHEMGCEFVSHTHGHKYLTTLTPAQVHADFKQTKAIMKDLGFFNEDVVVYPFGDHNAEVREIARQYFKAGVSIPQGWTGDPLIPPFDQFNLLRINAHEDNDDVIPRLDRAFNENQTVIMMSHVGQEGWNTTEINQLLDYAIAKGFEFVTMKEWMQRAGNIAQFGSTIIDSEGNITSDDLANVIFKEGLSPNAPMTDYPNNKITIGRITEANAPSWGLPFGKGGIIETVRTGSEGYPFQRVTSLTDEIFQRRYDFSANEWLGWKQIGGTQTGFSNNLDPSSDIRDFNYGVTYTRVGNAKAGETNTPRGVGGTLVTHKTLGDNDARWWWQEYHEHAAYGSAVHRRLFSYEFEPTAWIKMSP